MRRMLATHRWVAVGLALSALAATGCDGDDEPVPDDAGDAAAPAAAEMQLGKGEQAYAPLSEDETLPYAAGTQGGHHVYVGFRIRGLDPMRVLVKVRTSVEGFPELDLDRSGRVNFAPVPAAVAAGDDDAGASPDPAPPGSFEYYGWPAQILAAPMHEGA